MDMYGIDVTTLDYHLPSLEVVKGRTLHIDADFIAHQCSYYEDVDFANKCSNAVNMCNALRLNAGAENMLLHLTASGSTKGGRYAIARLKEYQGNRKGKEHPVDLEPLRIWLSRNCPSRYWTDREADDGMSQMQRAMIERNPESSVIMSGDKDLNIVPGYHLYPDAGVIWHDAFGSITLIRGKTAKLKGVGTKFFWAQMLMGDTADNISGIPRMGAVGAYDILKPLNTDYECAMAVIEQYKEYDKSKKTQGFKDYRTGNSITYKEAFLSEAQLLWMNTKDGEDQYTNFTNFLSGLHA